jgi:hypothetical protein
MNQLPIVKINGLDFYQDDRLHQYRQVDNPDNFFDQDDVTTAKLCGCNNCNAIMEDENPDDQPELSVQISILEYMIRCSDSDDLPGTDHWACPNCKTDGYWTDIHDDEHLKQFTSAQK